MFDALTDRLSSVFRTLSGKGRLDEETIDEGLREVRLALLDADVSLSVVKDFIETVKTRCLGMDVARGLNPAQQVVKIVNEELTTLLGGASAELELRGKPCVIMLVGLQGSGKTTSTAKIAHWLRRRKFKPYLVPADVYRPAAIDQLVALAKQLDLPFYPSTTEQSPVDIAKAAREKALELGCNVMLVDTAGRLAVDEPLMAELKALKETLKPQEILLVADAMLGQDATNTAKKFNEDLDITGVVLTKLDGDARGGAALSIKSVTGKPIKLVGVGEKVSELEVFHPDRAAGRILGMGDVLTLIEKAEAAISEEDAERMAEKMRKAEFNLEDFLSQMKQLKRLGSLEGVLKLIPGMGDLRKRIGEMGMPEKELKRAEAVIQSMTVEERRKPDIISQSRKERIARGSGVEIAQVHLLLKNFESMRMMMKKMLGGKGKKGMGGLPGMGAMPRHVPQGQVMRAAAGEEGKNNPFGLSKSALKKKKEARKKKKQK